MKKLEGEPEGASERVAIGSVALKPRAQGEEQSAKLALARDWGEFLAHEGDAGQADRLPVLKENATKAIKLDPTFAFGFYVLGRIATIEGLEGHGVRFFRRALGIDPNLSEAQRHLRLLTGSTPSLPVVDEPPTTPDMSAEDDELETSPAMTLPPQLEPQWSSAGPAREAIGVALPVASAAKAITAALDAPTGPPAPVAPPSVERPPAVERAPRLELDELPRSTKSSMGFAVWALIVATVAVVGILAWGLGRSSPAPELTSPSPTARAVANAPAGAVASGAASLPSSAPPSVSAPAGASAPASAAAAGSASAPVLVAANASAAAAPPIAVAPPLVPGASQGVIKTRWNTGHRLFVDGVVVGETPAQVLVTCGEHVVKVGSAGREQTLDVACGSTVTVDP